MNNNFLNGAFGLEVCIDLFDCDINKFTSEDLISFVGKLIEIADMEAHGSPLIWEDWEAEDLHLRGVSLFQWIKTSNIIVHSLSLTGLAMVNLFSCKPFDVNEVSQFAKDYFDAKGVKVNIVDRGLKK